MTDTHWTDIGALDDIPRRGARVVRRRDGCIAVFRTADDQVFALDDRCPHKGGPLPGHRARDERHLPAAQLGHRASRPARRRAPDEGRARTFR